MSTAPTPAEPAAMNPIARLFNVLFDPRATYEDIVRRPGWLTPVLLFTAFNILFTVAFTQRVGWERFMEQQFAKSPRTANMPAEQRAAAVQRAATFAKYFGYGGAALGSVIVVAALGGILLLAFNIIGGAKTNYNTSLAIVSHAFMPNFVAGLIALLLLYLKAPDQFDLQNPVAANVGAFLSSDAPQWLDSLGRSLDLFSFWVMFLLATGFAATNPKKLSLGKSLGIVFGLWALFVLVKVGWTAAFS
jgi:hypothetical protein